MDIQDFILRILPLLIPIFGVLIPLVVVTGRFVIEPLVQALTRLTQAQESLGGAANSERRLALLEERLEGIELALRPLLEEREFERQLEEGSRTGDAPSHRL